MILEFMILELSRVGDPGLVLGVGLVLPRLTRLEARGRGMAWVKSFDLVSTGHIVRPGSKDLTRVVTKQSQVT